MANWRDSDHHNNDGDDNVNNPVLTMPEFLDFHDENQQFCDSTQQTLDQIQEALATLLNWNPNRNDEKRRDNWACGHRGLVRDNGRDYQEQRDYWMKVELPSFNGNVSIEEYLDWFNEVEIFFRLYRYSRWQTGVFGGL